MPKNSSILPLRLLRKATGPNFSISCAPVSIPAQVLRHAGPFHQLKQQKPRTLLSLPHRPPKLFPEFLSVSLGGMSIRRSEFKWLMQCNLSHFRIKRQQKGGDCGKRLCSAQIQMKKRGDLSITGNDRGFSLLQTGFSITPRLKLSAERMSCRAKY